MQLAKKAQHCADGQYDSPGHCAELCSVACINNDTKMVLTVAAVHKIELESKKKCNEELRSALPRIMNHLYYCASLPKEDPQVIKENALSSLLHLCGIHEWQKNEKFEKVLCCCHPPELSSQNEVLLNPASSAYGVILNVLTSSQFLSDIVKLNGDSSTSYVESFNSIAIIYRLKRKF
uniref:Uncharacterized protein n=1 Tax=Ditylenchus dipsaci TaxID=166011 RepID=A0A915CRU8_9BILA